MKIIKNQETQKIELHFDKAEYMAMTEEQKTELKRFYLWSRYAGAWVSRSTRDHYWAIKTAEKLGFDVSSIENVGERLSYAEELEAKVEKAERRAERFEQYSENAADRAKNLQSVFDKHRGDIAFFTQPIIAGHSGSRAFANYRERLYKRYEKGMEEYRKSEYFKSRAAAAQATADMKKLKDAVYLHNRIKECNATIKKLQGHIVGYEEQIHKIQQGEEIYNWITREPLTVERLEECIQERLEKMEYEIDKLAFFENCLSEIGGIQFSRDNIKVGYIVKMKRWCRCEVLSAGPVNVTFKILDGGAAGGCLTEPYAAIVEIIEAKEPAVKKVVNPYQVGDILTMHYGMDTKNPVYRAYQVVKTTDTGVKLQQIAVEKGVPIRDRFISDKQVLRKVIQSKWSDWVGVYMDDWQLHKYEVKEMAGAV